jgi:hypothetical protein
MKPRSQKPQDTAPEIETKATDMPAESEAQVEESITESMEMAEPAESAVCESSDQRTTVMAFDAIREGVSDAKETAARMVPEVGKLISRTVYGVFYCASFGVVFGALAVAQILPRNGLVRNGIRDGAEAAQKTFEEQTAAEPAAEGGATVAA